MLRGAVLFGVFVFLVPVAGTLHATPTTPPSTTQPKPPRIVMLSLARVDDLGGGGLVQAGLASQECYALRHGLQAFVAPFHLPRRCHAERLGCGEPLRMELAKLLRLPTVDWVFYAEPETVVTNSSIALHRFLDQARAHRRRSRADGSAVDAEEPWLLLQGGATPVSGSFFIRDCTASRRFLRRWEELDNTWPNVLMARLAHRRHVFPWGVSPQHFSLSLALLDHHAALSSAPASLFPVRTCAGPSASLLRKGSKSRWSFDVCWHRRMACLGIHPSAIGGKGGGRGGGGGVAYLGADAGRTHRRGFYFRSALSSPHTATLVHPAQLWRPGDFMAAPALPIPIPLLHAAPPNETGKQTSNSHRERASARAHARALVFPTAWVHVSAAERLNFDPKSEELLGATESLSLWCPHAPPLGSGSTSTRTNMGSVLDSTSNAHAAPDQLLGSREEVEDEDMGVPMSSVLFFEDACVILGEPCVEHLWRVQAQGEQAQEQDQGDDLQRKTAEADIKSPAFKHPNVWGDGYTVPVPESLTCFLDDERIAAETRAMTGGVEIQNRSDGVRRLSIGTELRAVVTLAIRSAAVPTDAWGKNGDEDRLLLVREMDDDYEEVDSDDDAEQSRPDHDVSESPAAMGEKMKTGDAEAEEEEETRLVTGVFRLSPEPGPMVLRHDLENVNVANHGEQRQKSTSVQLAHFRSRLLDFASRLFEDSVFSRPPLEEDEEATMVQSSGGESSEGGSSEGERQVVQVEAWETTLASTQLNQATPLLARFLLDASAMESISNAARLLRPQTILYAPQQQEEQQHLQEDMQTQVAVEVAIDGDTESAGKPEQAQEKVAAATTTSKSVLGLGATNSSSIWQRIASHVAAAKSDASTAMTGEGDGDGVRIAIGVLVYRGSTAFHAAIESWHAAGLLHAATHRFLLLQNHAAGDFTPDGQSSTDLRLTGAQRGVDTSLAEGGYGMKLVLPDAELEPEQVGANVGIAQALVLLTRAAAAAGATHVLFLEEDWTIAPDVTPALLLRRLRDAAAHVRVQRRSKTGVLDSATRQRGGVVDVVRLRHRKVPGDPMCSAVFWRGREQTPPVNPAPSVSTSSGGPTMPSSIWLNAAHWFGPQRLAAAFPGVFFRCPEGVEEHEEEHEGQEPDDALICTTSRYGEWSNNPFLSTTDFLLRHIVPVAAADYKIRGAAAQLEVPMRTLPALWAEKEFLLAQGPGLFSHADIDKPLEQQSYPCGAILMQQYRQRRRQTQE